MQRIIKQSLLRFGGYTVARNINRRIEHNQLVQRVCNFIENGIVSLSDAVMFEPTQRCNLRCKMCYQDRAALTKRGEMTLDQISDFFDHNTYLKKVSLMGGEIFVRPDIIELIQHLDKTRNIIISTNGTLIKDSDINALSRCRNIITICISLDGPKNIHDSIRGVKGSYDKAVKTIKALATILPVTVTCVVQNDNIQILTELVNLCASLGVKKLKLELERLYMEDGITQTIIDMDQKPHDMAVSPIGRGRDYSLQTLHDKLKECQDRGKKLGIYVVYDPPYLMDEIEGCYNVDLRMTKRCICESFSMATIAPNGDVINCYAIRKPFGNILKAPFEEIWNSVQANAYRRELINNNMTGLCENCPFMQFEIDKNYKVKLKIERFG
ncbi:radical SAM protein [bacterium]|nr:radical SAM protein [bacterium]